MARLRGARGRHRLNAGRKDRCPAPSQRQAIGILDLLLPSPASKRAEWTEAYCRRGGQLRS